MDQEHRPTTPWMPHHKHCLARRPRRIAARRCRSPPRGRTLTIIDGARRLLRRRATTTAGWAPAARSRRVAFATMTTAAPPRMRPATGGTRRAPRATAGSPRSERGRRPEGRDGALRQHRDAGHASRSLSRGTDDLREPFDTRGSWRREERPRGERRTRLPSNGDVDPRRARGHDVFLTDRLDDGPRPRRRAEGFCAIGHGRDSLDWYGEVPPTCSWCARAPCRHRGPENAAFATAATATASVRTGPRRKAAAPWSRCGRRRRRARGVRSCRRRRRH